MKYVPDRRGLRELGNSKEMSKLCQRAAEHGRQWALRVPLDGPSRLVGEYRAGFRVEPDTVTVRGEPRAGALLINDSAVERIFGTRNRTLYRAIAQIEGAKIT